MSEKLISRNKDLKKLLCEGYEVCIEDGFICIENVPYVNKDKEIKLGVLISSFEERSDKQQPIVDHVIHFIGEYPCDEHGAEIGGIRHQSEQKELAGRIVHHSFSSKPENGYVDYHCKMTTYINILQNPAQAIDKAVTAKTHKPIKNKDDPDYPFHFMDTNTSRAEIHASSKKLTGLKVAIIGAGGTGSYILDFVSKTPVKEIHLFDDDSLGGHNLFRMPGISEVDFNNGKIYKVDYLYKIYSKFKKGIEVHKEKVTGGNIEKLKDMDFVFLCIDNGKEKKEIIQKLLDLSIPCIDVGIDININIDKKDDSLFGMVRTTTITEEKSDHFEIRISLDAGDGGEYSKNIQIAEINALNASLAVIRWKKLFGFYTDVKEEHQSVYTIVDNKITNND